MKASLRTYIALVVTAAVIFLAAVDWTPMFEMGVRDYAGLAVFLGLVILAEHLAVESRIRSSIAFLPHLAAATIFPASAIILGVIATCLATGVGRNDWKAGAFNIAQLSLAYGAAATVFAHLSGGVGVESDVEHFVALFVPFYAAAGAYFTINAVSVSAFIAIRDNNSIRTVFVDVTGKGGTNFIYDLLASPIALIIALLYSTFYVAGVVALVLPMLLVRHSYATVFELEQTNRDLLRVFVKAIETRDPYTSGHSLRVATLARAIGQDLGLRRPVLNRLETAAGHRFGHSLKGSRTGRWMVESKDRERSSADGGEELPQRWSSRRKAEIVLRLLRGEDLGEVSREIQVPASELEDWRRAYLEGAEAGLKRRTGDPLERELVRTRAKLGEVMMRLELSEDLLEKRGYGSELKKLLKRDLG
jgi:transposase